MAAPTLTRLCEQLALATGLPAADLKMRARAMRKAGIVPASARGAGATPATTREGIALLLAALGQGPQADAPATVTRLWDLGFQKITQTTAGTDGTGAVTRRQQEVETDAAQVELLRIRTLGPAIGGAVDQCRTTGGRANMLSAVRALHIWQDGSSAMVEMLDGKQIWYGPAADTNAPASMLKTAPIGFLSTAPAVILAVIADATLHPSALRADEPQFTFEPETTETKNAPQHKASGASVSMVQQQPGKAEVPDTQSDSRTERESGAMGFAAPSNVIGLTSRQQDQAPHGKVEPFRASRRP
jgi:hypothetical protein